MAEPVGRRAVEAHGPDRACGGGEQPAAALAESGKAGRQEAERQEFKAGRLEG